MGHLRPRSDGPPFMWPHPIAIEVVRRFPGHWLFGAAWWSSPTEISLEMPGASSPFYPGAVLRVCWPGHGHPDRSRWRCYLIDDHIRGFDSFKELDELPRAAAQLLRNYACGGNCSFSGRQADHRAAARSWLVNQPPWLQSEIDRLLTKDNTQ